MTDERAMSVPTNYVIMLAVVTILSSGLFVTASGFVVDQQEQAVRAGLEVIGNRLANDLAAADRLAQGTDAPGDLSVMVELPERAAGSTYTIVVDPTGNGADIRLRTTRPEITVTVPVRTATPVSSGSVSGGTLVVTFDTTSPSLEVRHE